MADLLDINTLITQTGGPTGQLGQAVNKAQGVLAQGVAAFQGPASLAAPLVGAISGPISDALHIKQDQATQIGGSLGMTVGMGVFGPVGGAVGQVFGQVLASSIEQIFPSKAQTLRNRENLRTIEDGARIQQFLGPTTSKQTYISTHDSMKAKHFANAPKKDITQVYQAFINGKVAWQFGIDGSENDSERKFYRVINGKVAEISGADFQKLRVSWWYPSPDHLLLTSNKGSDTFIRLMLQIEIVREQMAVALLKYLSAQQKAHNDAIAATQAAVAAAGKAKDAAAKKKADADIVAKKAAQAATKKKLQQVEDAKAKLKQQQAASQWANAKVFGAAMLYALVDKEF